MTAPTDAFWRDPRLGTPERVDLSAGTLDYHSHGYGPTLLFVHGYLVNANIWRTLVPLLGDRYRCITPDWPLGSHRTALNPGADLSPRGMGDLIAEFVERTGLDDVTLIGNDSGGAYAQVAAAQHPDRFVRLVLNSCETPRCSWPPNPGGFGLLKRAAAHPVTHRALYQPLRLPQTWRWPNTYGWLAKNPIEHAVMRTYVGPVLADRAIRRDGRAAISTVSADHVRRAADLLARRDTLPIHLLWAEDDRVFPLEHAVAYAERLGAELATIPESYTYTAEDQPERMAEALDRWLSSSA
ncbi:alpha/beta hydrolase [Nocardioides sp. KC13]|uniref:Alpha/beta hydrolase n=1 Tax=Nocardioides turkmenicus TaxID=2711220 RepID=A0A6M1R0K5_9ACTN|nr:alpha/beta hydrolase [Nocardioides sp. KC13]